MDCRESWRVHVQKKLPRIASKALQSGSDSD
jgi:hypothetical protein